MFIKRSNLSLIIVCLCIYTFLFASEALGITVFISVNPSPLDLRDHGIITCDVNLPDGYFFADVDTSTINLEGIPPESCSPQAGDTSFTCEFNRSAVVLYILAKIPPGADSIEMTLNFYSTDGTIFFEGTDIIRVIIGDYTITSTAETGGSIDPHGTFTINDGKSQEFIGSSDVGYEVDKWYLDDSEIQAGGTSYTLSNIQSNHTVHITFKQLQYTITPMAGPNGSIDPCEPVIVSYGSSKKFTASPDLGYEVYKWYLDNIAVQDGGVTYTLSDIYNDHTVTVVFKQVYYIIKPSAGPNGSIDPCTPVIASEGEDLEFIATPDLGCKVDVWFLDANEVQVGGDTYILKDIQSNHEVRVRFVKKLAFSLDDINFDNEHEFLSRIISNNFIDPNDPNNTRTHIARIVGQGPDPNGAMLMSNWMNSDPTSPNYGQIAYAHAKSVFLAPQVDQVLIRFEYLFNTSAPGVELVVFLSDWPDILEPDDPLFEEHYLEVARLLPPSWPLPGSPGSGRFAVFEDIVWTGHLDFKEGLFIEFVLISPSSTEGIVLSSGYESGALFDSDDTSVIIDSWGTAVQCYGICLDINWDNFVSEADFLTVISAFGCAATGDSACLEGVFGEDGTVDGYDIISWDWAMKSDSALLNFCEVPLVGDDTLMSTTETHSANTEGQQLLYDQTSGSLSDLLILGKSGASDAQSKMEDYLYNFDKDGIFAGNSTLASNRCNIRIIQDTGGQLYQLNSETGLLRLDQSHESVIPTGMTTYDNEPRYNTSANVYIGIQSGDWDSFGRPILDVAFDDEYAYVVPVVVAPGGQEAYTAAARLRLLEGSNPPYEVDRLYDDPPFDSDNQYRDNLREIEVDNSGNVYVLNVHSINESDILWRYDPNGIVERLDLGRPDSNNYVPAPVAMFVSKTTNMLYMASALYDSVDPNSTLIHGFSIEGELSLDSSITISGLQHVTDITEDPTTNSLWVCGFNMYDIPRYPIPFRWAFYYSFLAEIPYDSNEIRVIDLYDPYAHDLSLPMSILWTGSSDYVGMSLDKSGVNMQEFAVKADYWLKEEYPVF